MKNKILAVLTAAMVGVMSFVPVMTIRADQWEDPCSLCGEYSIVAEVVETKEKELGQTRPCAHGHKKAADIYMQKWELFRYYCGDCEVHWERWHPAETYWYCTYDGQID